MQCLAVFWTILLRQFPGFCRVEVPVGVIGDLHREAYCLPKFSRFIGIANLFSYFLNTSQAPRESCSVAYLTYFPIEILTDQAGRSARDVDVLPHEVTIDPCKEVIRIEIDVLYVPVQL